MFSLFYFFDFLWFIFSCLEFGFLLVLLNLVLIFAYFFVYFILYSVYWLTYYPIGFFSIYFYGSYLSKFYLYNASLNSVFFFYPNLFISYFIAFLFYFRYMSRFWSVSLFWYWIKHV